MLNNKRKNNRLKNKNSSLGNFKKNKSKTNNLNKYYNNKRPKTNKIK
jgi:hypothetical protein